MLDPSTRDCKNNGCTIRARPSHLRAIRRRTAGAPCDPGDQFDGGIGTQCPSNSLLQGSICSSHTCPSGQCSVPSQQMSGVRASLRGSSVGIVQVRTTTPKIETRR
jgi:hypothetical protein